MSKKIEKIHQKTIKNSKKYKNRKIAVSFVFGYNMDKDKQIYPLTARILRPLRWEMNCIQVEIKGERSSFMKVAGIIAEYNPFHKGHQYHIEETRKKQGQIMLL
mgnify:CR=1 FL=1